MQINNKIIDDFLINKPTIMSININQEIILRKFLALGYWKESSYSNQTHRSTATYHLNSHSFKFSSLLGLQKINSKFQFKFFRNLLLGI